MSKDRGRDAIAAAVTAAAAVILVSGGEYLAWMRTGGENEWRPVLDATLGVAGGAALLGALLGRVLPRYAATTIALVPGLMLFGKNLFRVAGIPGKSGWAGAIVVTLAAAAVFALIGRRRAPRLILVVAAVAALAAAGVDHVRSLPPERPVTREDLPDVILLVLDTLRYDRLETYGYDRPTSPRLAELAEDAQVYEQAWSVAPWTPPSHASMFTGLLPAEHNVDGQGTSPPLPAELVTLQEVLGEAGYRTAGFPANVILTAPGWDQGFDVYRTSTFDGRHTLILLMNDRKRGRTEQERDDYRTVHIFDRMRTWWSANDGAPRYAFLNLMDAHRKYRPLDEDFVEFLPDVTREESNRIDAEFWKRFDPESHRHDFDERELDILNRLYDAEIAGMDREIGKFLDWLAERGELDDTILLVTSDHGERLGERGAIGHKLTQDPYLLHVPLIVRWPATLAPERVTRRVQTEGIPGYVLHLAGLPAPEAMAKNALHTQDRDLVIGQLRYPAGVVDDLAKHYPGFDASRYQGDWVFVEDADEFCYELPFREEPADGVLTDFPADPQFTTDVSAEHPDRVAAMRTMAEALPRFGAAEPWEPTDEELEKLKALGYIR
jgi:arylsulfatase A-like enzyme